MKTFANFILLLFLLPCMAQAQTVVSGTITDEKGRPIPFANTWLDGIFDGATSNENGHFRFTSDHEGSAILKVSCIGFQGFSQTIELDGDSIQIAVQMFPDSKTLSPVTITAGSFEASDEKKAVILRPLDIVQTPGARGDIYGAIQKLPGVQPMADETGIFVRGGEAYETRTFIDGSLVDKPFFSEVPQIPGRGRFDPFLFKGTMFSTGAYSAEFGQALSSVLVLETQDMPERTGTSIGLNTAGVNFSHTENWGNTALLADVGYVNLQPLYGISQIFTGFAKPPEGAGGSLGFRQKTGGNGLIKALVRYDFSDLGIHYPVVEGDGKTTLRLKNRNLFSQASYKRLLGEKWDMQLAFYYSRNSDDITLAGDQIPATEQLGQVKTVLGRDLGPSISLKMGTEWHFREGIFGFNEFEQHYQDTYNGSFAEAHVKLWGKMAIRAGIRSDYSHYLDAWQVMPRLSAAYATRENSQFSLAYGQFYQSPTTEFLRQTDELGFEKATHFLANYQWMTDRFTFRAEAYHKKYSSLVRLVEGANLLGDPNAQFANNGDGYAQGIDLFWRDKEAFGLLDYWLTYSYLDTERFYRDFASPMPPRFAAEHTAQAVLRADVYRDRLQIGASFTFSSGRPYFFGEETAPWHGDRTPAFHQMGLNASYVTSIFKQFAVLYVSMDNPFGWRNITSYRFNEDFSQRQAINPPIGRQFFAGIFLNIR